VTLPLARLKAGQIVAILASLSHSFGRPALAPLRYLPEAEAEAILTALTGVGRKIAKCVLMYSLDREVLRSMSTSTGSQLPIYRRERRVRPELERVVALAVPRAPP
jgi:hypothetical protein